jgi:hypothetical protein
VPGQTLPNLVEVAVGAGGKVTVYNFQGSTDVIFDVAGYVLSREQSLGPEGLFNPLVPVRLLDTRDGTGRAGTIAPLGPTSAISVKVTGVGGVPATGVTAVVMNVTVTNPTSASFVTVWPTNSGRPLASNLNFSPGQTVPNRVVVKVGAGGKVDFYNLAGTVDVIADVNGWFTDATPGGLGARFVGLTPARILDTRDGTGGFGAPLGPNEGINAAVAGRGGVAAGARALVANVTVTNTTAPSFLTAWPTDGAYANSSDLNYVAGQTIANLVVVKVGADGKITLYNYDGSADVLVDAVGYYI